MSFYTRTSHRIIFLQVNLVRANMFSLDLPQQTTIITGATGGLGVALVQAILYAGSDAFCIDIHSQPPTEAWSVITAHATTSGVVATYFKCDVTREDEVDAALRKCAQIARERQRPVRGMVSAAGVQQTYDAFDFPESEFRRIMDVNVTGSFLVAKHVARLVKDTGLHGSIVLIASISGYIANRVRLRPPPFASWCSDTDVPPGCPWGSILCLKGSSTVSL